MNVARQAEAYIRRITVVAKIIQVSNTKNRRSADRYVGNWSAHDLGRLRFRLALL